MQKGRKEKLLKCVYTPKQLKDLITFILGTLVAITAIISNISSMFK